MASATAALRHPHKVESPHLISGHGSDSACHNNHRQTVNGRAVPQHLIFSRYVLVAPTFAPTHAECSGSLLSPFALHSLGIGRLGAQRLIHALRMQAKRGKLAIAGKQAGAIVWDTC
jgi:hypothetical protein